MFTNNHRILWKKLQSQKRCKLIQEILQQSPMSTSNQKKRVYEK